MVALPTPSRAGSAYCAQSGSSRGCGLGLEVKGKKNNNPLAVSRSQKTLTVLVSLESEKGS